MAAAPAWGQPDTTGGAPAAEQTLSVDEAIRQAEAALDGIASSDRASERADLLRTAERLIAQIEAADAANPWLHYLRGRAWAIGGTRPVFDAIGELNTFIETRIGQSYWQAYVALGDLYAEAWPVQAKSKYLRADELNPNHPKTLFGLSVCEAKSGEKEAALEYAKRAVQSASPDERIKYLVQLVRLYAAERDWENAYQAAIDARGLAEARRRNDPTSPEPLRTLETQLQLLINTVKGSLADRRTEAAPYLKLIEYIEELADVRRELAAFEALAVAELGVANTGPTRPVALDEKRVEILLYLGRRDDAVTLCEAIRARSPNSTVCADLMPTDDSASQP
jgi:tetratricopeptide (TPR) repeat protein